MCARTHEFKSSTQCATRRDEVIHKQHTLASLYRSSVHLNAVG
jgi:hypothetical protein